MTYTGLKTFLYAGVGKDDPRVKAAVDWIRRHYTLLLAFQACKVI